MIERIFGVFKRRFKLLIQPPEYPIEMQARFVVALSVLFNFIRIWDPSDIEGGSTLDTDDLEMRDGADGEEQGLDGTAGEEVLPPIFGGISDEESKRASERQDAIAKAMWNDYCRHLNENQ